MKKIIVAATGILVLLALGLFFFSVYYSHNVLRGLHKEAKPQQEIQTQAEPVKQHRVLVPSNPEDYGMVVFDEFHKPETQEQWNSLISEKIEEAKSQLSKDTLDKVTAKIAEEPEKTAQKLKTIDENIAKCKEILIKEPNNKEVKDKLGRLMILRSIAESLPPKQ
jgi:hypothetical protein